MINTKADINRTFMKYLQLFKILILVSTLAGLAVSWEKHHRYLSECMN